MTVIYPDPQCLLGEPILEWLEENVSKGYRRSLNCYKSKGWSFTFDVNAEHLWAIEIEDDNKAVEFKLRWL